jgi:hypothetical protein
MSKPNEYSLSLSVNGRSIRKVLIGRHYLEKHGHYMSDELILELVMALDGESFPVDSVTGGIEYYAADVVHMAPEGRRKVYRLIWLLEGHDMEVLGVINAYRRRKSRRRG